MISLAAGTYGQFSLRGKKFAEPGIRIEPLKGAGVIFSGLAFQASEGVEVKGVEIAIEGNPNGVAVSGSSRIRLIGLRVHAGANGPSNAMMLRSSDHLAVVDCDIRDVGTGINVIDSDQLQIAQNTFFNVQVDAIRGNGSNLQILKNRASDFHPKPGDHPDFIQLWGSKNMISEGNVIKDNVYERGGGDVVQGIFIEDNRNIRIVGNALVGTMYNGVGLARVAGALIEDNFVQGFADMGSRIIIRGRSSDVVIRGNTAQLIVNYEADGPNPGYKEERNAKIGGTKVGDASSMKAWLKKRQSN